MRDFEIPLEDQKAMQRYMHEIFEYRIDTGEFIRKVATVNTVKVGDVAGTIGEGGYRKIHVKGRYFQAHRLVWLFFCGQFPTLEIDHKNGIRTDNRLTNLRLATHSQNGCNQKIKSNNTSGVKGVSFVARTEKWRADIVVSGKHVHLGSFSNIETAVSIVKEARRTLHQNFANDGHYGRTLAAAEAD